MTEAITATCRDGITVAISEGLVYLLTPCHLGTGKGSEVESGVVCRVCYEEVDPVYGDCASVEDDNLPLWILGWLGYLGCQDPPAHAQSITERLLTKENA